MHALFSILPRFGVLAGTSVGRIVVVTALLGVSIATVAVSTTGAVFTSTQSVGANAFTTGSVVISSSPTTAAVAFSGMAPGDQVTAPITVSNDGSLQLRYAITSTVTSSTLAGQLSLKVKSSVTACTKGGFGSDGSQIYSGVLGTTGGSNIVGDPTQGAQAGDRVLSASASEILCFNVSLPLSTDSSFQGTSTTATLAYVAEQVANNS